jgi:hypothetical protein
MFLLPPADIRKIKIDPTADAVNVSLRRVVIKREPDSVVICGKDIITRFKLVNMKPVDSLCTTEVAVFMANGNDPYMILRDDIQKSLSVVNIMKTHTVRIALLLICLVIWFLLIRNAQITGFWINQELKNFQRRLNDIFHSNNRNFIFWIFGLIIFKYFLISAQSMAFVTHAVHDDAWYVNHAFSLANGQWLGNYSSFTLLHGMSYPLFIAFSNFLGISLPLAQYMLLVFSAIVFIYAVSPKIERKGWLIALFALILFNPMNSVQPLTRVLREGIYTSLGVLVFASFIGMLLHRDRSRGSLLRWCILTSVALFFFWNTREEGIIILPSLIWFSVWGIWLVSRQGALKSANKSIPETKFSRFRRSLLFLLPFLFLGAGNTMLATINYLYYGKFIVNELTSGTFPKANTALTKIADDENKLMVPVTTQMRLKAYAISPSFSRVRHFLDNTNNPFKKYGPGFPDEYEGGWFYFAFRLAADQAGMHQSLTQSQDFYQSIADEIDQAFRNGRLKKKELLTLLSFTWDPRYTRPFIQKVKLAYLFAISFEGYSPYPHYTENKREQIARFQNITLSYSTITESAEKSQTMATQLKYYILKIIGLFFSRISATAFLLSLTGLLIMSLMLLFISHKEIENLIIWAILTGLLMMIAARISLVAYLAVTQFNAIGPHYLTFVYPFILIFTFLSILFTSEMVIEIIRQKAKK